MLERLLVPLDGSETAEAILDQVRALLFARDAEVLLVQVVPVLPAFEGSWEEAPGALAALQDRAESYLGGLRERLASQGARARSVVRVGFPAETILDIAAKEKSTAIVMSTHGRTGLSRWAFGSVAEKILRAGPIPVLAVRSFRPDGGRWNRPFRRLLVCVDDSDRSLQVVPAATDLASAFGSKVVLLNVQEEDALAYGPPVLPMKRAYELFREKGIDVEPIVKRGDPASAILDSCAELDADLIAMTTHGRSGVRRWALGSVAERVLRSSTVPMLMVRASGDVKPAVPSREAAPKGLRSQQRTR